MSLRLLKFDAINPQVYIDNKIEDNQEVFRKMNRAKFLEWIISTRANFSDFYTYNLKILGWETQEFYINENYIDKVADELYSSTKTLIELKENLKNKIRPVKKRWKIKVISDYIKIYKPDVIFVREQIGIASDFWSSFSKNALLVSRIAAPIPKSWSPKDWDLILTSTETYKNFFEINGVQSVINHNGFDQRILNELVNSEKIYDVTFVGGLGNRNWAKRTKCVEYLAGHLDFKWWGYNGNKYKPDHPINKSWMGITSGLEMMNIYKQSKIVFNDYGEIAEGTGVNQRMFEVLGVGSLLITREAENLKKEYPQNIFVTFKDEKDCLDKINYYLANEKEREEIALAGKKYILENFTYKNIMEELDILLKESYNKKFSKTARSLKDTKK
ncbi:MAG: glycosyltransferase [Bacteroidota bacterium]|nr:glycosyltransferase [Bacteroidota bacterium]